MSTEEIAAGPVLNFSDFSDVIEKSTEPERLEEIIANVIDCFNKSRTSMSPEAQEEAINYFRASGCIQPSVLGTRSEVLERATDVWKSKPSRIYGPDIILIHGVLKGYWEYQSDKKHPYDAMETKMFGERFFNTQPPEEDSITVARENVAEDFTNRDSIVPLRGSGSGLDLKDEGTTAEPPTLVMTKEVFKGDGARDYDLGDGGQLVSVSRMPEQKRLKQVLTDCTERVRTAEIQLHEAKANEKRAELMIWYEEEIRQHEREDENRSETIKKHTRKLEELVSDMDESNRRDKRRRA
ncbi:hypothetical protein F53441_6293 [Fusarium austroafricanum]|uniref:Uncharacterized protein n=1 Tax=Fusarium austroafricanum TaxID=2364996 RepID=A0A8H4P792_9HYPO|nr:hypothetical protein F53441_6293 [Fusarium austroafricanum]